MQANICILADNWDEDFRGLSHALMQLQIPFALRDFKRAVKQGLKRIRVGSMIPSLVKLDEKPAYSLNGICPCRRQITGLFALKTLDEPFLQEVFGVNYAGLSPYRAGYLDMSPFADQQRFFQYAAAD